MRGQGSLHTPTVAAYESDLSIAPQGHERQRPSSDRPSLHRLAGFSAFLFPVCQAQG